MGFRFSRRIKILPGVRVNFSARGASLSLGPRGASVNFSSRGTFLNTGIPGTGISHRERIGGSGGGTTRHRALDRTKLYAAGDRANDDLIRQLEHGGTVEKRMSPEEARKYLEDPRIKFIDPKTGRKVSARQMEARIRTAETEKRVVDARQQVADEEAAITRMVEHWLPLPEIPDRREFESATAAPFPRLRRWCSRAEISRSGNGTNCGALPITKDSFSVWESCLRHKCSQTLPRLR